MANNNSTSQFSVPNNGYLFRVNISMQHVLANKLGLEHKCSTRIIPYVLTWDGVVTTYHKKYSKEIGLADSVEAYIQTIVLKKTLESIPFDFRRNSEPDEEQEDACVVPATE